ncbi:hypothetical protein [Streptomyces acidicola]|uniref:hypothetical protein n=1 Tax=Streptomyces acidicola TaxID=2596892 RepID=UPI00342E00F7
MAFRRGAASVPGVCKGRRAQVVVCRGGHGFAEALRSSLCVEGGGVEDENAVEPSGGGTT